MRGVFYYCIDLYEYGYELSCGLLFPPASELFNSGVRGVRCKIVSRCFGLIYPLLKGEVAGRWLRALTCDYIK